MERLLYSSSGSWLSFWDVAIPTHTHSLPTLLSPLPPSSLYVPGWGTLELDVTEGWFPGIFSMSDPKSFWCTTAAQHNLHESYSDIMILSYYQAEWQARNLSGVITWEHHICVNTYADFTSLFANIDQCPKCGEPSYKEKDLEESDGERKVPWQVFTTLLVSPQIQACWKYSQTAKDMFY